MSATIIGEPPDHGVATGESKLDNNSPDALAAYRRARSQDCADAPLVEAPRFTAPPSDRRGLPMHYFPPRPTSMIERAGSLVRTTFSLAGLRPAGGRGKSA